MDPKERDALDKCFHDFRKDLILSGTFLHSLYVDKIITEAHIQQINSKDSEEAKVTLLMSILPRRGPNAYKIFLAILKKDNDWLAGKLELELSNLKSDRQSFPKRVSEIIKLQLNPLLHGSREGPTFDENCPDEVIKVLEKSLRTLDVKCQKALNEPVAKSQRVPLPLMIKGKMIQIEHKKVQQPPIDNNNSKETEHEKVQATPRDDDIAKKVDILKTKNRELKKDVKDQARLKTENEKLTERVRKLRGQTQEASKMKKEIMKLTNKLENTEREKEKLKEQVNTLKFWGNKP
ncbi:CRADD-like protein [Mya arenaria]|uniref:CRADD-like protein n=1 Tax=Mya arenaria TaxID=6604 RepID=A0ABY7FAC5_MYAAR|nr:uncharacterized protein LOC128205670 [Mya arenaria]WAR17749.1 CRADD-like protein [Mya arenaria]